MFKIFTIGISLVWFSIVTGQSFGDNFKLAYPDLVHQGKSFEVSIITSNEFENADKLDLYIIPKSGIKPDAFYLKLENQVMEIEYTSASTEGYLYDAVMFSIDFTQSTFKNGSSFFQILMRFKSEFVDYSEIEFYGEFRKNNRLVDYLNSTSEQLRSDYPNHYRIKINFYKSGIREKALLLQPNSEFSIHTDLNITNNMLFEYWINLTQNGKPFLEIKNNRTSLVEYSLVTNEFQILTCESDYNNELTITPHFMPDNSWNHISILFSFTESKIVFYCNEKEFSVFEMPLNLSANDLIFSFKNESGSNFQIDQLRVIDYNESITASFKNRIFSNFISDSSEVKVHFSFNETTLSDLLSQELISLDKVTLLASDAPIFERAPGFNIKVFNNYYELTWSGGDFESAKYYIVERSDGENEFVEIYNIDADNLNDKKFSFITDRRKNSEIIYYRVKQINKDGSVLYSSQVKVGQGELEEFIINQNFPNPFNPTTQISIEVLVDSNFEIVVYSLEGKEVDVLHNGYLANGTYQFKFDGSELPSGIYLYKVSSPNFSRTKKMILAK
ncbi:MAG: T9SS type A sorting domain-containing protein [Ignavibacteria bacterium]|nr:T9SS type A sorting domain-containing protein [Ignavibacteria bacterium]